MAPRRRTVLRIAGIGCSTILGGCSGLLNSDQTTAPTETGERTGTDTSTDRPSPSTRAIPQSATATEPTPSDEPTSTDESTATNSSTPTAPADDRRRSHFRPHAGFARVAPWLESEANAVTVKRVREPTREAFEDAVSGSGPRVVVFETSGTIDLGGEQLYLSITDDKLWIAGQTAPSPGITLVRGGLSINANDCVIQHVRCRAGDAGKSPDSGWEPDSLRTGDETKGNVIDHCTATWGIDETLSVGFNTADTTVTNCLIAEALHDSTHHEGSHGFGSIGGGADAQRSAFLGTVWALNSARNPRMGGSEHVIVNTVVYRYDRAAVLDRDSTASFVGNGYLRPGDRPIQGQGEGENTTEVYVEDNFVNGDWSITNEPWVRKLDEPPAWPSDLTAVPSSEVVAHNLAHAGARPADRTPDDRRIVAHVQNGTGDYINSQSEVGGYPDLPANTRDLDVPAEGLRSWLQEHAVAVEARSPS